VGDGIHEPGLKSRIKMVKNKEHRWEGIQGGRERRKKKCRKRNNIRKKNRTRRI